MCFRSLNWGIWFAFLILLLTAPVFPQIAGGLTETTATGLGGNSFITGIVFWPSGRPVNVRMGIRLNSPTAGEIIAMTDDRGQFVFSGLTAGSYLVLIDGEKDFEAISQPVDVLQSRSAIPQTYVVSIRLTEKTKAKNKPEILNVAIGAVPKRASEFYKKAQSLSTEKDYEGAVEHLKLAIAEFPGFLNAYNELAVQYQKLGDFAKAEVALISALRIKPDAFEPMLNRGIVLFRMNRFTEAEQVLRNVLKAQGQSAIGHFYLGRTLAKLESYEEAEKELNLSITIGGTEMNEAHRMLAMMYIDKDDRPKAVSSLETYLKLVPTAPDAEKLRDAIKQLKGSR
ncbi:MAG: tetratricopeptide repeat protein [Pyrinomonadaceae bacterium]